MRKVLGTRREFLRGTAAASLIGVSSKILWGADAPSNRVRLCFAGVHEKGRGQEPMRWSAAMPGVEIAYVCDPDRRAQDWAAAKVNEIAGYAPKKATDIRKVLEDRNVDAVFAEVPDHWHAPMAWMTMEAGKHIYCEKPCTFTPSEGDILVAVQRKTGRVFQMGNQRRSSTAYRPAVEALRSGIIGEIKYGRCWYQNNRKPIGPRVPAPVPEWLDWDVWQGPAPRAPYQSNVVHYNWHWSFQYGTGEIANSAVHYVDVARWAMGLDMPDRVSALGVSCNGDVGWDWPGLQMLSMTFPGDKMITWDGVSSLPGKKMMDIYGGAMIYGTLGTMYFHPHDYVVLYDEKGEVAREWHPVDEVQGEHWKPKLDAHHIRNFLEAVRAADPSKVHSPVVDSVRSSLMTHLGNLSVRSGLTLHVDTKSGVPAEKEAMKYWTRDYEPGWSHA